MKNNENTTYKKAFFICRVYNIKRKNKKFEGKFAIFCL